MTIDHDHWCALDPCSCRYSQERPVPKLPSPLESEGERRERIADNHEAWVRFYESRGRRDMAARVQRWAAASRRPNGEAGE